MVPYIWEGTHIIQIALYILLPYQFASDSTTFQKTLNHGWWKLYWNGCTEIAPSWKLGRKLPPLEPSQCVPLLPLQPVIFVLHSTPSIRRIVLLCFASHMRHFLRKQGSPICVIFLCEDEKHPPIHNCLHCPNGSHYVVNLQRCCVSRCATIPSSQFICCLDSARSALSCSIILSNRSNQWFRPLFHISLCQRHFLFFLRGSYLLWYQLIEYHPIYSTHTRFVTPI